MNRSIIFVCVAAFCLYTIAENPKTAPYTVIANPGEQADRSIRLNWHTDPDGNTPACLFTHRTDTDWSEACRVDAERRLCTAYDSLFSKLPNNEDWHEKARFVRNTAQLDNLDPDTEYMYRFTDDSTDEIRYFKTAPTSGKWTAAIISDFHAYTPLPRRVDAAMAMLDTLESANHAPFDLILHAGDVCAWGGSYSFWKDLYANRQFKNYVWAGVNGNHDNMARGYARQTNEFFLYANNNPENGYEGEIGVCYHFRYGDVLFIMLNNENMRDEAGLSKAQTWVRKVIAGHPAPFVVVMEHYQWFFGNNGKFSQYERWHNLFDECGVDLAISGNNHIYARTNAIYKNKETDGKQGTVYVQTPSSDNGRGRTLEEWTDNQDLIKFRWSERPNTVGALLLKAESGALSLTLHDRSGRQIDSVTVRRKR